MGRAPQIELINRARPNGSLKEKVIVAFDKEVRLFGEAISTLW